ncbi:MAG: ATP-binding cassette domain-containing protein [Candidatus Dormibacteraeota bacterium]|nr:ATP-binding cassette domain-containing protein [Candidatus Dormibacteraeota bacterium]
MAPLTRRLAALVAGCVVAAIVYPMVASGPDLDRAALALGLAGPAAGAALAAAAGRPPLAAAALAGVGAYVSGLAAIHGVPVPAAVVLGAVAGGAAGGAVAAIGLRLDAPVFLVMTLLLALAAGAAVQALPSLTGGQSGLGPLPSLSLPLGGGRTAVLTPVGDFHALLAAALAVTVAAAVLLERGPGPAWRAVGSDRERAGDTGIRPATAELTVLAAAGLIAAFAGALAAHVARAADPQSFAPDVAALPLLAALAAGRKPLGAALVAVATGLAGEVVLPALNWQGPPSAQAVALGVLAVATLFTLLPGGSRSARDVEADVDPAATWPVDRLGLAGAGLAVAPLQVRSGSGALLLDAPGFEAVPGGVVAVVGPNGAGKTTLLRTVARRAGVALLPQEGGGFASCTVAETLRLAARAGRKGKADPGVATAWLERLGLSAQRDVPCAELAAGQRRLLDLARAIIAAPAVLLCDEPLAGLDDGNRAAAVSCLRAAAAAGATIVISEHDREAVASLATRVVELERQS